jgi:hypothetical protein
MAKGSLTLCCPINTRSTSHLMLLKSTPAAAHTTRQKRLFARSEGTLHGGCLMIGAAVKRSSDLRPLPGARSIWLAWS